jgi:hypothetical protein
MEHVGPLIALGLLLAGVSALIVARVAARRLLPVLLLWLFSPAILMVLALLIGNLLSPARDSTLSNAIFATMLIGIFVVIPWAVVCALGFLAGFALRRRWPPRQPNAGAQPTPAASERLTAAPITPTAPLRADPPQRHLPADAPATHVSQLSPDGSLRIDIQTVEWASGLWVNTPRIVEVASGRILCDLHGTDWEAHVAFPRPASIWLGLRRYRSPGYLFAEVDLDAGIYQIALCSLDAADEEGPLGDISDRLEHWWPRATALAASAATKEQPVPPPGRFAAWKSALVILLSALIAIAGLTWFSMKTGIEPPHVPIILRPGAAVPH